MLILPDLKLQVNRTCSSASEIDASPASAPLLSVRQTFHTPFPCKHRDSRTCFFCRRYIMYIYVPSMAAVIRCFQNHTSVDRGNSRAFRHAKFRVLFGNGARSSRHIERNVSTFARRLEYCRRRATGGRSLHFLLQCARERRASDPVDRAWSAELSTRCNA